jgi:hypothetical protein
VTRAKGPPPFPSGEPGADCSGLRCACGSLLARYVPGGVELTCRRCKRTVIVPAEGEPDDA